MPAAGRCRGAFCFSGERLIRVWAAALVEDGEPFLAVPGKVTRIAPGFVEVATGDGKG